jgi:hypothetical protein
VVRRASETPLKKNRTGELGFEPTHVGVPEDNKDRLLADVLAILDLSPINPDEVRYCLAAAKRAGLNWRALYKKPSGCKCLQAGTSSLGCAFLPVQMAGAGGGRNRRPNTGWVE